MKFISFLLVVIIGMPMAAVAKDETSLISLDDTYIPIIGASKPSPYLEDAIDKPMIWNKGWDTSIGNIIQIDPTVNIVFKRIEQVFGHPGIIYTGREIRHWGEQRFFNSSKRIYAKAVLMVDKGSTVQGGAFEWSLNKQGFISFHNILRTDSNAGWIRAWTDPRRGEKVWFFIMSDDEKYSSNPISFTWP